MMNHQEQDVAAAFTEFGRLGCLFASPFGSSCYQQHQDHYKSTGTISGFVPADWREPWHQEGNSCETDDSEAYVPESDFNHSSNTEILAVVKAEPKGSTVVYPSASAPYSPTCANLDGIYSAAAAAAAYHQHAGCFYSNALYGKGHAPRGIIGGSIPPLDGERPSAAVKLEPTDNREYNDLLPEKQRLGHPTQHHHHRSGGVANGRRGSLQLWQFLVALLDAPDASDGCIAWTGRGMEFKLIEPEEVARRWGAQKNRPAMNYDKLSRSLRYYYEKGIMQKVAGERYVYKFVCDPEALFNMAYGGGSMGGAESSDKLPQHEKPPQQEPHQPAAHHLAYADMLNLYNCGIAATHSYHHLPAYLPVDGKYPTSATSTRLP